MNFGIHKISMVIAVLFLSACSAGKSVYRQNDLTMAVIEKEFIQKKRPVNMRFYVRKDLMYEDNGYVFHSQNENHVVFQYYDHDQRKFVDLEIPLKNISEISYKAGAFEFHRNAKIAAMVGALVTAIIIASISI